MNAQPKNTDPTVEPYTGRGTGYLGTGFTFDWICRNGIVEDNPAIMRYNAFKHWLALACPVRGTRPDWAQQQLMRLSGNCSVAKRAQTPDQLIGYNERNAARMAKWLPALHRDGGWAGDPPDLPHVSIARGKTRIMEAAKQARRAVRPALSWREQCERDIAALQELGHAIPRSLRPTQTRHGTRPDGSHPLEPVPMPVAYHPWISCVGRDKGKPCPYCVRDGEHRSTRLMHAGRLDLKPRA